MSLGASKNIVDAVPNVTYNVFISPSPVSVISSGGGTSTSPLVTANISGGVEPYTFLWEKVSGDNITIMGEVSQTTSFNAGGAPEDSLQAEFRVTVADGALAEVSDIVTVTFDFI